MNEAIWAAVSTEPAGTLHTPPPESVRVMMAALPAAASCTWAGPTVDAGADRIAREPLTDPVPVSTVRLPAPVAAVATAGLSWFPSRVANLATVPVGVGV